MNEGQGGGPGVDMSHAHGAHGDAYKPSCPSRSVPSQAVSPFPERERPDSKERCSPPQGHSGRVQGWGVLVTRGHGRGPGAGARQTCSVLGSPVRCGAS